MQGSITIRILLGSVTIIWIAREYHNKKGLPRSITIKTTARSGSATIESTARVYYIEKNCQVVPQTKAFPAAPVAEWVRSLYFSALNHSIISSLCLV